LLAIQTHIDHLESTMLGDWVEIPVAVEQWHVVLDSHRRDHAVDWLADGDASSSQ